MNATDNIIKLHNITLHTWEQVFWAPHYVSLKISKWQKRLIKTVYADIYGLYFLLIR